MLRETHDGGHHEKKKTDGSRRHGRIRFYAQAAPGAENAGHQRDRAFLPAAAQADLLDWFKGHDRPPAPAGKALEFAKPAEWQANLTLTPEDKVAGYNNFYEFGLDKADPAANAGSLRTDPWTLTIGGEVAKPLTLDHDDLTKRFPLEERIYRMRCVEAWSMVVPWVGFPLHKLLALVEPTSSARYVAFKTLYAPDQMPGQKDRFIGGGSLTLTWRGYGWMKRCTR